MKITRSGHMRDRGETVLVPEVSFNYDGTRPWANDVWWRDKDKTLSINIQAVPHSDGITLHNYRLTLSLADISALIEILGHIGSSGDAGLLRRHLSEKVPEIVRILACATGVSVPSVVEEAE